MRHQAHPNTRARKHLLWLASALAALVITAVIAVNCHNLVSFAGSKTPLKNIKNHLLGIFDSASAFYNLATARPPAAGSPLPTFEIFITESRLGMLNADLPGSGDVYQPARLRTNNDAFAVSVKYRGDNSYHWAGPSKSWAVKFKKNDNLLGFRYLHLINPRSITGFEMLGGNFLGESMGLITAPAALARLFVNGRYEGVVQSIFRPDEKVLRYNKVMPGDLYDIEPSGNWADANSWKKAAFSNSFPPENTSAFQKFLNTVTSLNHSRNMERDRLAFERTANIPKMLDLWIVHNIAGSMHQDSTHNQKWYVDPLTGLAEPLTWDVWGHGQYYELAEDLQMPATPPHLALLRYADLISRKNAALYRRVKEDTASASQKKFFKSLWKDSEYSFASAPIIDKGYMTIPPFRPMHWPRFQLKKDLEKILSFVDRRNSRILKAACRNDIELLSLGSGRYIFRIKGQVGAELASVNILPGSPGKTPTLQFDSGSIVPLNQAENSTDVLMAKNRIRIYPAFGITANPTWHSNFTVSELWAEIPFQFNGAIKSAVFRNLADDSMIEVTSSARTASQDDLPDQERISITDMNECRPPAYTGLCRWTFESSQLEIEQDIRKIEFGPGLVRFNQDREFSEKTTVIFLAGTTVEITPDVSLVFRGQTLCLGTEKNPVTFQGHTPGSGNPADQWKLIALTGTGTAGSRIEHTRFIGGKGGILNNVYYTAAVNFIHTRDISINHSHFSRNSLPSDDIVHIARSRNITVSHSTFREGQADGLDIDIASVRLVNNRFIQNGNDGLDLMTSTITASNNLFSSSGDKGISAGEETSLSAVHNHFENNAIGIAVKDLSRAKITNNDFKDCSVDIGAYKKSTYYGPGGIILEENNSFEKGSKPAPAIIQADPASCINRDCLNPDKNIRASTGRILARSYKSLLNKDFPGGTAQ